MIPTTASTRTHRRYVKNIIDTWERASEDQLHRGKIWYRMAHDLADLMSEGNVTAGAGVITALSAQKSWALNTRMAQRAFSTGVLSGHTTDSLIKAAKIMAGADPAEVLPMTFKTGNFYRTILDPEDPDAVVIDRHTHDVAVGKRYGIQNRGLHNKTRYATLAHAYREAARQLGELPSIVQATTWLVQSEGN